MGLKTHNHAAVCNKNWETAHAGTQIKWGREKQTCRDTTGGQARERSKLGEKNPCPQLHKNKTGGTLAIKTKSTALSLNTLIITESKWLRLDSTISNYNRREKKENQTKQKTCTHVKTEQNLHKLACLDKLYSLCTQSFLTASCPCVTIWVGFSINSKLSV